MPNRLLLTGGTGFVGREIVRQLKATSWQPRLLVRNLDSPRARDTAALAPCELVQGNMLDVESLSAAMTGVEAVIHLVGIIGEVGQNTFANAHTRATMNGLRAAQTAGVRRWIQMSALGTRAQAVSRYHQTKWAAEEAVRWSGLDWTIFRPSLIYGAEDHFVNLFARMSLWSPVLPVIGAGRNRLQPVAVGDVAQCFVRALNEPMACGATYDLGGDEVCTFTGLLDAILAVLRRHRIKLHLPLAWARLQARGMEWAWPRWLGRAAPLNRDQLLMLQEDNVGDSAPAQQQFGLRWTPFREGIAAFLRPGRNVE